MDVARIKLLCAVALLATVPAQAGQTVTTLAVSVNVVEGCVPAAERPCDAPPDAEAPAPVAPRAAADRPATEPVPLGWIRFTHLPD